MEDINFSESGTLIVPRSPFVERASNFSPSGPKVSFKITRNLLNTRTVPSSQTSQFASFIYIYIYSFIVSFSKLLRLQSRVKTQQT